MSNRRILIRSTSPEDNSILSICPAQATKTSQTSHGLLRCLRNSSAVTNRSQFSLLFCGYCETNDDVLFCCCCIILLQPPKYGYCGSTNPVLQIPIPLLLMMIIHIDPFPPQMNWKLKSTIEYVSIEWVKLGLLLLLWFLPWWLKSPPAQEFTHFPKGL